MKVAREKTLADAAEKQRDQREQDGEHERGAAEPAIGHADQIEIDVEPPVADIGHLHDAELRELVENAEVGGHLQHARAERLAVPR